MSKHDENRVLGRLGARELTPKEVENARSNGRSGQAQHTNVITFNPVTGTVDGDGL